MEREKSSLQMFSEPIPPVLIDGIIITEYSGERSQADGTYHSFHGEGRAEFFDGGVYQGSFFKGQMHGFGTMHWTDGTLYEGEFKFNRIEGEGKLVWPDGSSYTGDFKNGLRHGTGIYVNDDFKVRYEGEFYNSKRHGHGRLCEGESTWYEGEWKEGSKCGKGQIKFVNGEVYDGEWKNNSPHGFGCMYWPEKKEKYIGEWVRGKPNGRGQYFWNELENKVTNNEEDGSLPQTQLCNHYDGEWVDGARHGLGTFYYADGSRYHGAWIQNQKHGDGVYTFSDGRVYVGQFVQDKMTGEEPESEHSNGASFGTIGVELFIDDLVPGIGPNARRVHREVENVLLRWNGQLRSIFFTCSQILKETQPVEEAKISDNEGELFTMKLWQMWVLCRVCKIPDENLSLAHVDRIISIVRVNQGQKNQDLDDIHNRDQRLLFREFIEALVRIAHAKYAALSPDGSLSSLLLSLVENNLSLFNNFKEDDLVSAAAAVDVPELDFLSAFEACSVSVENQANDQVTTSRQLLKRLSQICLVGSTTEGMWVDVPKPPPPPEPVEPEISTEQAEALAMEKAKEEEALREKEAAKEKAVKDKGKDKGKGKGKVEEKEPEPVVEEKEPEVEVDKNELPFVIISTSSAMDCICQALFQQSAKSVDRISLLEADMLPYEFAMVTEALVEQIYSSFPPEHCLHRLSKNEFRSQLLQEITNPGSRQL